jgi:hypothetical protein
MMRARLAGHRPAQPRASVGLRAPRPQRRGCGGISTVIAASLRPGISGLPWAAASRPRTRRAGALGRTPPMDTRERRKQLGGARVGAPRRYVEGGLQLHAGAREHLCARERATCNARRARQAARSASHPRMAAVGPKQRGRTARVGLFSVAAGWGPQPVRPARSRRRWQRAAARSARGRRGGRRCAAPIGRSSCARTPAAERGAVLCGRVGPKGTPRRWQSFTSAPGLPRHLRLAGWHRTVEAAGPCGGWERRAGRGRGGIGAHGPTHCACRWTAQCHQLRGGARHGQCSGARHCDGRARPSTVRHRPAAVAHVCSVLEERGDDARVAADARRVERRPPVERIGGRGGGSEGLGVIGIGPQMNWESLSRSEAAVLADRPSLFRLMHAPIPTCMCAQIAVACALIPCTCSLLHRQRPPRVRLSARPCAARPRFERRRSSTQPRGTAKAHSVLQQYSVLQLYSTAPKRCSRSTPRRRYVLM